MKSNKNIIIQRADKGNIVIVLDRKTYVTKMKNILSDDQKFLALDLTHDQAQKEVVAIEERIKNCLSPLYEKNVFDDHLHKSLLPVGSQPGKLYGLCKVHKEAIDGCPPFRPIISAINTPSYNLAKFLLPILEPITKNYFVIKDSFSFVEDIKGQNSTYFMASFDVESLFTNIPLDETIGICVDKLYPRKNMKFKGLRKNEFRQLLELATKESLILFDNHYYRQIDGVAMGSPLGPTLANIFLCHYEEIWLDNCPLQFKPEYYRRYVDDTFVLFKNEDHVKKFNKYLNSRHANMRFSSEVEDDLCLNFLDILIRREGEFITSIYRKPTFSGIYSHFNSYAPLIYKKGLIYCLVFRIFHLCSTWSIIHDEINHLKCFLLNNKYPLSFIESAIRKMLEKLILKSRRLETDSIKKEYNICLPFLGKQTVILKKRLQKLFSSYYPSGKLKIIFKTGSKLGNIFTYKDKSPFPIQSLLLYLFTCSSCNATYIGKTKRHNKIRMCEHLGISSKTGKNLKYNSSQATVVREHLETLGHVGEFDCFKILGFAKNDFELLIKESLVITKMRPTLNRQCDSFKLLLF